MPAIAAGFFYYYSQIAVSADQPTAIIPAIVISLFILVLGAILRIVTAYLMRWLELDRPFTPVVNRDMSRLLSVLAEHQDQLLTMMGQFLQGLVSNVKVNDTTGQNEITHQVKAEVEASKPKPGPSDPQS